MSPNQITPEQCAASGSEDAHQLAIQCWAALNFNKYPELKWLHHSPNGGFRNKREAGKLKAMGVKRGFPDLTLLVRRGPYSGLLIELKTPERKKQKDGGASQDQLNWGEHLHKEGFGFCVCYGWQDAVAVLENYLNWKG